jgi:hypothetical protein
MSAQEYENDNGPTRPRTKFYGQQYTAPETFFRAADAVVTQPESSFVELSPGSFIADMIDDFGPNIFRELNRLPSLVP